MNMESRDFPWWTERLANDVWIFVVVTRHSGSFVVESFCGFAEAGGVIWADFVLTQCGHDAGDCKAHDTIPFQTERRNISVRVDDIVMVYEGAST